MPINKVDILKTLFDEFYLWNKDKVLLVKTIDVVASTASTKSLTASEAEGILKVL